MDSHPIRVEVRDDPKRLAELARMVPKAVRRRPIWIGLGEAALAFIPSPLLLVAFSLPGVAASWTVVVGLIALILFQIEQEVPAAGLTPGRITVDEHMVIQDAVAVTDFSPFRICPDITPNFKKLIGLKIKAGFNNAVKERLGGVAGCTHLVELMGPIATTAFQTLAAARFAKMNTQLKRDPTWRPPLIDTCHAWAADGPIVARDYPQFATAKKS